MSNGHPRDLECTREQLLSGNPIEEGLTWLRHKEDSQADHIDLMLLAGNLSLREMAVRLNSLFGDKTLSARMSRIRAHLDHLQNGPSPPHKVIPHELRLKRFPDIDDGKWMFDSG